MPVYDYYCVDCKKNFTITLSIKEYDQKKVSCPKCKGTNVERTISCAFIKTSKKS